MFSGPTVFTQIMAAVPAWEFRRLAQRHGQLDGRRHFTSWEHLLALCFAQLTFRESLRDIAARLGAQPALRYHLGFRRPLARSTSPNAVRVQLWTAIIAYLCAAITRHRCCLARSTNLTTFLQVVSLHALSKVPVPELFGEIDTMGRIFTLLIN